MAEFPRTQIGGLSVSRMIIGTNWFLGFSHTSQARDRLINDRMDTRRIADVLEVFLRSGIDTIMGIRAEKKLLDAMKDAEDRTGRKLIKIGTPTLDVADNAKASAENARILDEFAALGAAVLMPHQQTTDALIDRTTRTIRRMDVICRMIRERHMIPGLSAHMPEAVVYADESGLDVETYIQIYNALGFLMQIEVDWAHRIIQEAKKPVITIKPLASGKLIPLVGLTFSWCTIRDQDMVNIGVMSPDEAREVIEISLSILERRRPQVELQRTRSKESVEPRKTGR